MAKHQTDDAEKVETDISEMIVGLLNKGLGAMDGPFSVPQIVEQRWNLLHEDLSLPTAVLYEEKLAHNLAWMQQFIRSYGVNLAPARKNHHGACAFQTSTADRRLGYYAGHRASVAGGV